MKNYIYLESDTKIKFAKNENNENNGVFLYYYLYANSENNDFFDNFSFVCPFSITICYFSCKTCIPNKIPSLEKHFCTSCINGYYSKDIHTPEGFNCIICHKSCKSCINEYSCNSCKEDYYFKSDINNNIINNGICYNSELEHYYLDNNVNIENNGEIITSVYKPCYKSCQTCLSAGTYENNNCKICKPGKKKYPFNEYQCTLDKQDCLNNNLYWKFDNDNIECISDCDKYIIVFGDNKGQCIDDCQNFNDPYLT